MKQFLVNTSVMVLMILISGLGYVRLASDDLGAIHQIPETEAVLGKATWAVVGKPAIFPQGIVIIEPYEAAPADVLAQLHGIILQTPRTRVLVGSVEEGMITYVTRSLVFGFPDYTTVKASADVTNTDWTNIKIYARLRFGTYDFKVNSRRVYGWLKVLKPLN